MSRQTLNEETVKNRYLVPYLERLGLTREELDFERSFTLRLGRQEGQPPISGGRLDILVRRGMDNLMVVEVKAEGEPLTDKDRDQAISYARLLNKMAPVALVTNCSDFRLYDVISREEIRDEEIDPEKHFQVVVPPNLMALRDEALTLFLGYSPENLAVFCRAQVAAGIAPLRGSAIDRNKKYIPELFVHRSDLHDQIRSFLSSSRPLFVLLADAGLGKTCSLCAITESLLDNGDAALFYRGTMLPKIPPLEAIADDFTWTFAEEQSAPNLTRRLRSILADRPLVIVIDAVDEWTSADRVQDLLLTVRRLSQTNIKIILSCKIRAWQEFSTIRGESTGIVDFLFGGTPYILPIMSRDEFHDAIDKYRDFYGVQGGFEDTALDEAKRSPFLLRVLFEVAEHHRAEDLTFSSLQFFHYYYDKLIHRFDDPTLGDIVLRDVARLLFENKTDRMRIYDLDRAIGFEKMCAVLGELQQFQILETSPGDGDESLLFYFSLLRDYLVAFRVSAWHTLPSAKLSEVLRDMSNAAVHVEALAFFYRYAEAEQKRAIDAPLFERAKAYIELYDDVVHTHFSRFRVQFPPYTQGEIGFVGEFILDRREIGLYGFRERTASDEDVLLLPYPRYKSHSNLPYLYGAKGLHAYSSFWTPDVRDAVLTREILPALQRIIDHGLLDESCCPELAAETVAVEVARNRAIFSDTRNAHSAGPVFPLSVPRVRYWLRHELLYNHFKDLRVEQQLRSGEIEVVRYENGAISYSWNPTWEDIKWIRGQVENHVHDSEAEVRRRVQGAIPETLNKLDVRLSTALNILEDIGIQTIDGHPFDDAADHWSKMWRPPGLQLQDACEFVEKIFTYTFPIIRRIVRHNFPTLAHEFPTLSSPFIGIAAVNLDCEAVLQGATIYLCEPDPGQEDVKFVAHSHHDIRTRIVRSPAFRSEIYSDGTWRARHFKGFIGQRFVRFSTLFRPRHGYLESGLINRSFGQICPVIRALVYDWIREEMAEVYDVLCKQYGIRKMDHDWSIFIRPRN